MQIRSLKIKPLLVFSFLFLFISWLAFLVKNPEGGSDAYMHYLIARYVPQHPENLLDHWGKPLFTLLSFPFAQFGFEGAKLFSALCAVATAYFTYKTCCELRFKHSMVAAFLLLFSTIFFKVTASFLTEIVFALLLAAAMYYALKEKSIFSAILVSFIPFTRTEGVVIILAFLLFFLFTRKYKAAPFLLLGTLLYSLVGGLVFDDYYWLITRNPYGDASAFYGRGEWYHFLERTDVILGMPLLALFIAGTILFLVRSKHEFTGDRKRFYFLFFIACGSFYMYFVGHSYVWYKGVSGSLGLIRVIAAVIPAAVIIAMFFYSQLLEWLKRVPGFLKVALSLVLVIYTARYTYDRSQGEFFYDDEIVHLLRESGEWYRESPYAGKGKVYYFAPLVAVYYNIDPFDFEKRAMLNEAKPVTNVPEGSIIVWDGQFGPNECHLQEDWIRKEPSFELLKEFNPRGEIIVLNGYSYKILIFRKRAVSETQRMMP